MSQPCLTSSDYYQYNVDTDTVAWYEKDVSCEGGPPPGFTQRGCICNPESGTKLLLLFSGLVRERTGPGATAAAAEAGAAAPHSGFDSTQNSLWALDLGRADSDRRPWTLLYSNANNDARYWREMGDREPCPRYAHQLVAAGPHGTYLFGGNPGDVGNPRLRLDDMWRVHLSRRVEPQLVRQHLVYLIRRQQYITSTSRLRSLLQQLTCL